MSHGDDPTTNPVHALLAELGIVDPIAVADTQEQHAEIIAAYRDGKLTEAALRHSLARASNAPDAENLSAEPAPPYLDKR